MHSLLLLLISLCPVAASMAEESKFAFQEVWAYCLDKEKNALKGDEPITDIVLFSAAVNEIGALTTKLPEREGLSSALKKGRRIHLAITAAGGKTLMYFCLSKDRELRKALIANIVEAAHAYDGVQIDFEAIRAEEKEPFIAFLKEIKQTLPREKIFSVCLPARTRELKDAFPYREIGAIADRVIVMAYDEHWRGGPPGPIASIEWCQRVMLYAQKEIPAKKLVMGIPFYGRVWQNQEIAKALKYTQMLELWKKYQSPLKRDQGEVPSFSFKETIEGMVYFEDVKSLRQKFALYEQAKIENIAFWRVSQEPFAIWSSLKAPI